MTVLGLLILVAAAAVTVGAIARGGADVSLDFGSFTVNTDAAGMFLTGAATLLVAVVGLWMLRGGVARSRQRRKEMRELRDRAARNEAAAKRERAAAADARAQAGAETGRHADPVEPTDPVDSVPPER